MLYTCHVNALPALRSQRRYVIVPSLCFQQPVPSAKHISPYVVAHTVPVLITCPTRIFESDRRDTKCVYVLYNLSLFECMCDLDVKKSIMVLLYSLSCSCVLPFTDPCSLPESPSFYPSIFNCSCGAGSRGAAAAYLL